MSWGHDSVPDATTAPIPSSRLIDVAPDTLQDSVDELPLLIVTGLAVNELITGATGGTGSTVTRAEATLDPKELLAVSV